MLKEMLTSDQLSIVISQAAAPAFLLGAIASFLSVLVSHMGRVVDRAVIPGAEVTGIVQLHVEQAGATRPTEQRHP